MPPAKYPSTSPAMIRVSTLAFAAGIGGQRLVWRDRSGGETAIGPIESTHLAIPSGRQTGGASRTVQQPDW